MVARNVHPNNMPPHHDLDNVRRFRRDVEALLRTYDEVKHVWPTGASELYADLHDGRKLTVTISLT